MVLTVIIATGILPPACYSGTCDFVKGQPSPVTRAMGQVQEVMERAGPQAVRELWWAGLPMALAGRIASFIPWFTPDQRGVAAVLIVAAAMLAVAGLLSTWALV